MVRVIPPYSLPLPETLKEWRWWHFRRPSHHVSVSTNVDNIIPLVTCHVLEPPGNPSIFLGGNPLDYTFAFIMLQFILVVFITRLLRFLLKPLKQPRIISEIIGGIVVGPSVMKRNARFVNSTVLGNAQFVINTIGIMGFMFFLFVYGVKTDPGLVKKTGKKHIFTGVVGIMVPTISAFSVAMTMRKNMDRELAKISSIGGIASYLGIASCPVVYSVLCENNLISSEVGRTALSIALISDLVCAGTIVVFEAGKHGETGAKHAMWYVIALVVVLAFLLICVRRAILWIVERTPGGKAVHPTYVVCILLGVFAMGFVTDFCGIAIANGPLWLGLLIPDGPPLGTAIVEKSETIMMEILMPFAFMMVGYNTDVYALSAAGWSHVAPLFFMALSGYLSKFLSTWISTILWRMPFRDGLSLSLLLSLRGQVELILFVHWMDKRMIKVPGFTIMVLMTIAVTATFAPLVCILHDPSKPYMVNKRRTIQHNPADSDLVIVLGIFDPDNIGGLIRLLELSASPGPISVLALHLIKIVGRVPLFIDHDQQQVPPKYTSAHAVNALTLFQNLKGPDAVKLRFFTAVTTPRAMYHDVCVLALHHRADLIILPYCIYKQADTHHTLVEGEAARSLASHVLSHAPCSVAILVDKSEERGNPVIRYNNKRTSNMSFGLMGESKVAILFLGGADSREALVFADRMAAEQEVSLTVVRFLSFNGGDNNEVEKKMDDGTVTWFWVKNERKKRVEYREVVVANGEDMVTAIQGMNDGSYDLWIVGRRHGMNPELLSGLSCWSEDEELGLIGDYVASVRFSTSASVLVIQQQILRG